MSEDNWKAKPLIVGGVIGAALGLLAGYLYVRMAEETGGRQEITTGNVVKLAVAAIALVRQAAQLAG